MNFFHLFPGPVFRNTLQTLLVEKGIFENTTAGEFWVCVWGGGEVCVHVSVCMCACHCVWVWVGVVCVCLK